MPISSKIGQMGAKKRVLLDLGRIYVGDYIWVALMRSVNQGFVENGFDAATAAEFGKRRNPQCAICFDACRAICLVLSLSLSLSLSRSLSLSLSLSLSFSLR